MVINLLNKGTICLTQKKRKNEIMLSRPVIKMNIICGVENRFNRGKTKKTLAERWASTPYLSSHLSASSLTYF